MCRVKRTSVHVTLLAGTSEHRLHEPGALPGHPALRSAARLGCTGLVHRSQVLQLMACRDGKYWGYWRFSVSVAKAAQALQAHRQTAQNEVPNSWKAHARRFQEGELCNADGVGYIISADLPCTKSSGNVGGTSGLLSRIYGVESSGEYEGDAPVRKTDRTHERECRHVSPTSARKI